MNTRELSSDDVVATIFSAKRLTVERHNSQFVTEIAALGALRVLSEYKDQVQPPTYETAFENIGTVASKTMAGLLIEASIADTGATYRIRNSAKAIIDTAGKIE